LLIASGFGMLWLGKKKAKWMDCIWPLKLNHFRINHLNFSPQMLVVIYEFFVQWMV
jgi:hypothetical protein